MANEYEILIIFNARHHFTVNSNHYIYKHFTYLPNTEFARIGDYITILLNDKLNDGTGRASYTDGEHNTQHTTQ